jgi:hypothetical protein
MFLNISKLSKRFEGYGLLINSVCGVYSVFLYYVAKDLNAEPLSFGVDSDTGI